MMILVVGLIVLLAMPSYAANVELSSSVDERRQFTCPGELIIFTCQVFGTISLEWRSPLISSITYTAFRTPPDTITRSPFEANLISVNTGNIPANSNITSTLRMTEPRNEVSVQCLNAAGDNRTETFTTTEIPRMPRELSVEFDNSNASLLVTITWLPPGNSGQLDLEEYTVNVTTTSGINNSTQVPAGTTELQLTTDRTQRATFNVTITATNMCGQTGNATSEVQEYDPSSTATPTTTTMMPTSEDPQGLTNVQIIGIAVGGGGGGVIIVVGTSTGIICCCCCKKKKRRPESKPL